ncbi:MAG: glycosyltransferase family 39 protein [Myxococcales bacterium]|nr:glycosyltransferase family 39 protein [Myxococcales bacterium]
MDHRRTPLRWVDGVIALVLGVVAFVVLWNTAVMGFARDESFYFRYSHIYQDWFSRVAQRTGDEAPGEGPLDRADVLSTWRENFEHPPLMKVLFGFSWRLLAERQRPLKVGPGARLTIVDLTESDGFEVDDEVELIPPTLIPEAPWDEDNRYGVPLPPERPAAFAVAVVASRTKNEAVLTMDGAALPQLEGTCRAPASPVRSAESRIETTAPWVVGCRAVAAGVLPEHQAMRLPTWVFFALLIAILYLFGTELFGRRAGLFAAVAFFWVPHHFFHGHLCTFDMPVTTMIVATTYTFWKSLHSRFWVYGTAVLWGLSLLTKLNGYFIPVPFVVAWLYPWLWDRTTSLVARVREHIAAGTLVSAHWRPAAQLGLVLGATLLVAFTLGKLPAVVVLLLGVALLPTRGSETRPFWPPMPAAFLWMLAIGLPMQFIFWPQMWFDTAENFGRYVSFHVGHVHYPQEYFGDLLNVPPFPVGYPFVMTLLTVPVPVQALMALGLVLLFVTHRRSVPVFERVLLFGSALLPIGIIALPSTPIFGGVKHWIATLAFGALIGGFAFEWLLVRTLDRMAARMGAGAARLLRNAAPIGLVALVTASGAVASVHSVAWGTGYWNELIGGTQGAADARMMRKFWGFGAGYAVDYVNAHAPRGATVAFHESTWDAHDWYQRAGLLREDLRWTRNPPSRCRPGDLFIFHHQGPMAQDEIAVRESFAVQGPVKTFALDGVPMVSIYRCGRRS